MENKNLIKVINKINSDKELSKKFSESKTIEEMYEFCNKISSGYTFEEFKDYINKIADSVENKIKKGEISEQDLDNISGGSSDETALRSVAMLAGPVVSALGLGFTIWQTLYNLRQQRKAKKQTKN